MCLFSFSYRNVQKKVKGGENTFFLVSVAMLYIEVKTCEIVTDKSKRKGLKCRKANVGKDPLGS